MKMKMIISTYWTMMTMMKFKINNSLHKFLSSKKSSRKGDLPIS
jgi:hypothetical protein